MPPYRPAIERFLEKVKWSTENFYEHPNGVRTPCLEWQAAHRAKGYGSFWNGKKQVSAYRWFFEFMFTVEIPKFTDDGEPVHTDHLCRNPPCVWPGHLEIVTQRENLAGRGVKDTFIAYQTDRCVKDLHDLAGGNIIWKRKRRQCRACLNAWQRQNPNRPKYVRKGQATKLTADQVRAIRKKIGTQSKRSIARDFGVTDKVIMQIERRITWKHVT